MKKLFAAACLALIAHSLPCLAEDEPPLPPPITAVASVLQLSADQVQALVAMIHERDVAIAPLAMRLQQDAQALDQLVQKPDADAAAAGRLLLEMRALQVQIEDARKQASAQFEQLLTPEQRDRLQHIRDVAPLTQVIPAFRATGLL